MRRAWIVLFVVLGGCSSGSVSSSPQEGGSREGSIDPLSVTLDKRPIVVCFGDSLTAGFGVADGRSYPDYLQKLIDEEGYEYRVVNEGISGETTQAGLVRTQIVATRDPEFVILAFGGNDGLRGLEVNNMKANLAEMIRRLREAGARVVLAGIRLPPNYGSQYTAAFGKVYPVLAREMDVPLIPFLLEGVGGNPEFMQPDGLHPNSAGNRRVARNVWEVLEPLLAAERQAAAAGGR